MSILLFQIKKNSVHKQKKTQLIGVVPSLVTICDNNELEGLSSSPHPQPLTWLHISSRSAFSMSEEVPQDSGILKETKRLSIQMELIFHSTC